MFRINKFITLKLIEDKTIIFIQDKEFQQCKYLLLNIPIEQISRLSEIESVDEAIEKLDTSYEKIHNKIHDIPPEVEFWGHCSNLQVWVEENYKSSLLHRNLAFPLLKKLTQIGDPIANHVFKEEIARRILSNHSPTVQFLLNEAYIEFLTKDELKTLIYECLEKKNSEILYLLHQKGYFKIFSDKELQSILEDYYKKFLIFENEKASELFQLIVADMIRKQFPSKEELFIGYEDELRFKGNVITLEIRNKHKRAI